jgi:hypothetical protein
MVEPEEFQRLGAQKLGMLEERGFRRRVDLEECKPVLATLMYVGTHRGFEFSFDVRDQYVDAYIFPVRDGRPYREGYFGLLTLWRFLAQEGAIQVTLPRGRQKKSRRRQPTVAEIIDGYVEELRTYADVLLCDEPVEKKKWGLQRPDEIHILRKDIRRLVLFLKAAGHGDEAQWLEQVNRTLEGGTLAPAEQQALFRGLLAALSPGGRLAWLLAHPEERPRAVEYIEMSDETRLGWHIRNRLEELLSDDVFWLFPD